METRRNPQRHKRSQHPLLGASLGNLLRLSQIHGAGLSAKFYLSALARSPFMWADWIWFLLRRSEVQAPIFILGHWRSGTTHLYNVLSKGEDFGWVSPYMAALPLDGVSLSALLRPLLRRGLPKGRFIDQMEVTDASPQEDEFAIANRQSLSFLHAIYFPNNFDAIFNKGLFFQGASPAEIACWKSAFTKNCDKLAAAHPQKTLLIKNPVYTARLKEVLALYPDARFVHIHRNPYKIFFSMRNFYYQLFKELSLQPPKVIDIDTHILTTYTRMMNKLASDSASLPKNQYIEVAYQDFVTNPLRILALIYSAFGLTNFERDKNHFISYLNSISKFRQSTDGYSGDELQKIEKALGFFINKWGYRPPESMN